jgi:predicted SprT family Zn-dependent metalloprotease
VVLGLDDAESMAKELMAKYRLHGYQFQFDNAVRRFGSCNLEKKLIKLSKPLTLMNSEGYLGNVLLHEISHAETFWDQRPWSFMELDS